MFGLTVAWHFKYDMSLAKSCQRLEGLANWWSIMCLASATQCALIMCEVSSYNHGNDSHRRLNWIESSYEDQATKDNNFTRKEEWQFCTSYSSIPQVPIVGNGQKNQAFWERVGLCYD
jgi:hypothetical protein